MKTIFRFEESTENAMNTPTIDHKFRSDFPSLEHDRNRNVPLSIVQRSTPSKVVDDPLGRSTLHLLCCSATVRLLSIDSFGQRKVPGRGREMWRFNQRIGPGQFFDEDQSSSSRRASIGSI
jgi:hypothetical protein